MKKTTAKKTAVKKNQKSIAKKTTAKKTVAKKRVPKKRLSASHKEAIGNSLRSSLVSLAHERPEEARRRIRHELAVAAIEDVSGRDIAATLGVSATSFYRDVIPACGITVEDLRREVAETIRRAGSDQPPAVPVALELASPWWLTPVYPGETDAGTATALAASAVHSAPEHESQVAASLYWHSWATLEGPGGKDASKWRGAVWMNPVGTVLSTLAKGQEAIPSDDVLRSAPPALVNFAAYLAGEVLDSERKHGGLVDEERQKAASRWLIKLIDMGYASAARVLVRCTRTAASVESGHACTSIARAFAERENSRQQAIRLGQETTAPALTDAVYKILMAAE